jgi:hypothetical protein
MLVTQNATLTTPHVLRFGDTDAATISALLARYGLAIREIPRDQPIPGSFWGDEEAGLLDGSVLLRVDTPLHSILHEACHYVCMDQARRGGLDTDAGGDYDEENAVCYLQILLADELAGFGRRRMMVDMDAWGYSFRLGSARAWFERDAEDARAWLLRYGLIGPDERPAFRLRQTP